MSHDLRQLKDHALRLLEKGKLDEVLAIYGQLTEAEPREPRWPQKAAELWRKLGQSERAIACFAEAARRLAEEGFLVKAIALCKVILGLNPKHTRTQQMLAELYATPPTSAAREVRRVRPTPPAPDLATAACTAHEPRQVQLAAETLVAAPRSERATGSPHDVGVELPRQPDTPPSRPRTIPPGGALDAVKLRAIVPDAQPRALPQGEPGEVIEIPLDSELEAAFAEAIGPEVAASPSALRLPTVPLLSALDQGALRRLIERVTVRHVAPGESIIREGERGDVLYILVEGQVVVWQRDDGPARRREIDRLLEGAFFGEIALLTHLPRSASVDARTQVTVLELSREVMAELIDEHPPLLKVLLRFFRERLIATLTETSEIFVPFAPRERQALVSRFTFLEVEAATRPIVEGRAADALYILLCGVLEARRGDRRLAELGAGSVVGEMSLLGGGPAVATIVALTTCWLLRLDRRAFQELIMTHPHVLACLSELADRRQQLNAAMAAGEVPYAEARLPLLY
jgi:CRP-like cAMP-binding protein